MTALNQRVGQEEAGRPYTMITQGRGSATRGTGGEGRGWEEGGGLGGLVEGPEETRGSQGVTCTSKPPLLAAIPRQAEHYSFQFSGRQNKPTF